MSQISLNTQYLGRPDQVSRVGTDASSRRTADTTSTRATDQVDFSDAARQAAESGQPVRLSLVQRIREQIANGTYETPDKLALTANDMARALRGQG